MKKLALLITVLILTGCSAVPIVPKWPDVPEDMLKACPELDKVSPENDKLTVVLDSVADNYKHYYDCSAKVNDWVEWYQGQQKIWKTIK